MEEVREETGSKGGREEFEEEVWGEVEEKLRNDLRMRRSNREWRGKPQVCWEYVGIKTPHKSKRRESKNGI